MTIEREIAGRKDDAAILPQNDQYQVILPCDVKDFGTFVSGLLGKPEVLKGRVTGNFEVEYQDVANIYHLVHHRVDKQNLGHLVYLSITVYYDNGTSATHNDIEKFKTYHPTEKCYPIEIVLSFTYLLYFPQTNVPEKQVVEVSLSTERNERRQWRPYYDGGLFEYRIEYTDRTWATDISGLLKNHAKALVEEHSKIREFIRCRTDELVEYSGLLILLLSAIFWATYSVGYIDHLDDAKYEPVAAVLNALKYLIVSGTTVTVLFLVLFSVRRYAEYHIHVMRASYILLVDADRKHRDKQAAKERNQWLAVLAALAVNIAAGIAANYILTSNVFGMFH